MRKPGARRRSNGFPKRTIITKIPDSRAKDNAIFVNRGEWLHGGLRGWFDEGDKRVDDEGGEEVRGRGAVERELVIVRALDHITDDNLEERGAEVTGGAAKAGDGSDGLAWEKIADQCVEIRAESLVRGGGKAEHKNGEPEVGNALGEEDREHGEGTDD